MDKDIKTIAKEIEKNGGRLYLVGGAVRDKFLNKTNHDEDYCITGMENDTFEKLFPEAISRGKAFNVYELGRKRICYGKNR